ncbi:MAG: hypothetical protein Q6373_007190 [Candidatus Sigynarchaeota archaeon]
MPSEFAFRDRWEIIGSLIIAPLVISTIHVSNTFIFDQFRVQDNARAGISVFSDVIPCIVVIVICTRYLVDGLFKRKFIVYEDRVVYSKGKYRVVIPVETIARIEVVYHEWHADFAGGSVYTILRIHKRIGNPLKVSLDSNLLRFPASYCDLVDVLEVIAKERGIPFDVMLESHRKYTKDQEIDQIEKYRHPRVAWKPDKKRKLRISQAICIIMGVLIIAFFITFGMLGENDVTHALFTWAIILFIMWPFSLGAIIYYKC